MRVAYVRTGGRALGRRRASRWRVRVMLPRAALAVPFAPAN
jgi:hypothetical protein